MTKIRRHQNTIKIFRLIYACLTSRFRLVWPLAFHTIFDIKSPGWEFLTMGGVLFKRYSRMYENGNSQALNSKLPCKGKKEFHRVPKHTIKDWIRFHLSYGLTYSTEVSDWMDKVSCLTRDCTRRNKLVLRFKFWNPEVISYVKPIVYLITTKSFS